MERLMFFFLLAALLGGCAGGDTGTNPNDTGPTGTDDTGTDSSTLGWLDADALVLGSSEPSQANVFDVGGNIVATDYTGDNENLGLKAGSYTVSFGYTAEELYPEDEDFADDVADLVDDLPLHQDENGDYWTGPKQAFSVTAGSTTPVAGELSLVPAMCPFDEDGCDGQNDEVGQWTCAVEDDTWQDFMSIEQNDEGGLSIYVPCIGDLNLEGDRIFSEGYYDGGFITAGYIEVYDLHDSSNDVMLWVGRDGDEP